MAGFAAFVAHRSLHSRAVVSVVALWFERALAMLPIAALVLRTREAQSAFVGRAAAFAASSTFGCRVPLCSALATHPESAVCSFLSMPRFFA